MSLSNISLSGENPPRKPTKHCRLFGWSAGDCQRLHCERCGYRHYLRLSLRIVRAAKKHEKILFVTVYFDWRKKWTYEHLPMFQDTTRDERLFRELLSKVLRSVRDKARREGAEFEYCAVQAFGSFSHRIHKHVHSHVLCTWLPELVPMPVKNHPDRMESDFLSKRAERLGLAVWVENPRSREHVSRYTAANIKSALNLPQAKNLRVVRFSEGFE